MKMKTNKGLSRLTNTFLVAASLLILVLTGCAAVGPDYKAPDPNAPDHWRNADDNRESSQQQDLQQLAEWWKIFNDPTLNELIDMAVKENRDLKKARAAVREARAARGSSQAGYFPTVDGSGSASRSTSSENNGSGETNDLFSVGFDASWELDVFGGVRRSVEAAEADLGAAGADLEDVMASLTAETGTNYIEVRSYQARLDVAENSLKSLAETADLTKARFQAGLDDELAVLQANYNLEDAASTIPTLKTGLEGALNRLAVLTGKKPGALHEMLKEPRPIPTPPPVASICAPAEALRRRPDVRKAERELAAQTARIGEAEAELYPKFKLNGSISLDALKAYKLFTAESLASSYGPSISWNIFDGGAIRRNIEIQTAKQEQYLMDYETTVLEALEEVENALTAYAQEQARRERLNRASELAGQAEDLAQKQYQAGLKEFSSVLEAQRQLLTYRDELAQSDASIASDLITLYKALGGGWDLSESKNNQDSKKTEGQ